MKRTVELTKHQGDTWVAVLSQFPTKVVNRAILTIGLSQDPFPDLGKLVLLCQQILWSSQSHYAPGRDTSKVGGSVIAAAAKSLELDI